MNAGPYDTEAQAVAAARVAGEASPLQGHNLDLLMAACTAAGVSLGAYDSRILAWLANYESATCAVVAGLIERAHAAGLRRLVP